MCPKIKPTVLFQTSAGVMLLALASALFLINFANPIDLVAPHDPILGISIKTIYWTVGSVIAATALDCLFAKNLFRQMLFIALVATNFFIYRIGLILLGGHDFVGLLGGFTYAFGLSAKATNFVIQVVFVYLFFGSYSTLWWLRIRQQPDAHKFLFESKEIEIKGNSNAYLRTLKISCMDCGGHIEFPTNAFGVTIPCPHCQAIITLQKVRNLKMSCPTCEGRIEFPDYAAGQIIACPHCKMDVTLKKPI